MVVVQSDFWYEDIIDALLEHGAHVNYGGIDNDTELGSPLGAACAFGNEELVDVLLNRRAALNGAEGIDCPISPLLAATAKGQRGIVKKLLKLGAAVDSRGSTDETSLMSAVESSVPGAIDLARLLLDHGASVNAESIIVGYSIQAAAAAQNWECVKMLIEEYGADINARGGEDWNAGTALDNACERDNEDMTRYLLEKGAVDTGSSALKAAWRKEKEAIVEILLDHCPDDNAASSPRNSFDVSDTALRSAALHSNLRIVEMLFKASATDANNEISYEARLAYRRSKSLGATAGVRARMAHLYQVYKALQSANARKRMKAAYG